jgi:hypothetical protein
MQERQDPRLVCADRDLSKIWFPVLGLFFCFLGRECPSVHVGVTNLAHRECVNNVAIAWAVDNLFIPNVHLCDTGCQDGLGQ